MRLKKWRRHYSVACFAFAVAVAVVVVVAAAVAAVVVCCWLLRATAAVLTFCRRINPNNSSKSLRC